MNINLTGKTALVTGGNTGIGRAIALGLAQAGADVALTYFSNPGEQTIAAIRALGRKSLALRMDATDSTEVNRVVPELAGALAQGAVLSVIDLYGWLAHPTWAALAFLPVTVVTAALALAVELWRREGSPLSAQWWKGWSRPLYLLLAADLLLEDLLKELRPGAMGVAPGSPVQPH